MAEYPTERLIYSIKADDLIRRIYGKFVATHKRGELVTAGCGVSHSNLNGNFVRNVGQKLNRLNLLEACYPVCVYEGNSGDYREFDPERSLGKLDSFFDGVLGKVRKE